MLRIGVGWSERLVCCEAPFGRRWCEANIQVILEVNESKTRLLALYLIKAIIIYIMDWWDFLNC